MRAAALCGLASLVCWYSIINFDGEQTNIYGSWVIWKRAYPVEYSLRLLNTSNVRESGLMMASQGDECKVL